MYLQESKQINDLQISHCFTVSELILKIQESVDGDFHQEIAFQKLTFMFR